MKWLMLTLILWGGWSFLPKLATKHLTSSQVFIIGAPGGVLVALAAVSLGGFQFETMGFLYACAAGLCNYLGVLLYIISLSKGEKLSLAVSITGLYPAVTVFLGVTLLGEQPSSRQWIGIFLAAVAVTLLNMPQKQNGN